MNTNVDLTLSLAADGSALPSLFFRPADRLRLEGCVAALTQEGRSLALSSSHEAALDHYGKLLTERLRRAAPQCQVEVYFPTSTDALVDRFNEVLAGQTMKEAMTEGLGQIERIWIVHDAGALAEHELQLLARLVSNFPGANIRTVLLLGPALRSRKAFESLGRRFVRWDIEAPTLEQAQLMLGQAREEGCENLVASLLRHLQPAAIKSAAAEPFSFSAVEQQRGSKAPAAEVPFQLGGLGARIRQRLARLRWPLQAFSNGRASSAEVKSSAGAAAGGFNSRSAAAKPVRKGVRLPKARWILTVAGLAALSVAVSAWLHGGRFGVSKPAGAQPVKDVRSGVGQGGPSKAVDVWAKPLPAREVKS